MVRDFRSIVHAEDESGKSVDRHADWIGIALDGEFGVQTETRRHSTINERTQTCDDRCRSEVLLTSPEGASELFWKFEFDKERSGDDKCINVLCLDRKTILGLCDQTSGYMVTFDGWVFSKKTPISGQSILTLSSSLQKVASSMLNCRSSVFCCSTVNCFSSTVTFSLSCKCSVNRIH